MHVIPYVMRTYNILEIGGHCGTSSIAYSSFLNDGAKIHVYYCYHKFIFILLYYI